MLVELAIGDAYGAGFEYAEAEFVAANNGLEGYVRNPRYPGLVPGSYTDDTQPIAVAELLLSGRAWTGRNIADQFVEVFRRDPRQGYSRRTYALLNTVAGGDELIAGIDARSDRSGAAMRAGPIGLGGWLDQILTAGGRGGWAAPWRGPVGEKGWMSVRAALTVLGGAATMSQVLRRCVALMSQPMSDAGPAPS
jgi:ADP-ribosyl-[dinitrogen reductase] hydrolase